MTATKLFPSGAWQVSDVIAGQLVTRQYYGFSRRKAIEEFNGEMAICYPENYTPAQLIKAGVWNLPCGFSLAKPFRERLPHYRSCKHGYCQARLQASEKIAVVLRKAMRKSPKP